MGLLILDDVKTYIGINLTNLGFDHELLVNINSIYSSLELSVGLVGSPTNIDETTPWFDYGNEEINNLVKHLVQLKTKLIFDPISNVNISTTLAAHADILQSKIKILVEEAAAAAV